MLKWPYLTILKEPQTLRPRTGIFTGVSMDFFLLISTKIYNILCFCKKKNMYQLSYDVYSEHEFPLYLSGY